MRTRIIALLAASMLATVGTPFAAAAQTAQGTPAFRVPIGSSTTTSSVPPVYAWMQSVSECSSTCGSGTRSTDYQCQNASDFDYSGAGYGAPEADALCTASAGPKPASSTSSCTNYSACSYDWVRPTPTQVAQANGADQAGRVGCGWVHETFSPYCQRTEGDPTSSSPRPTTSSAATTARTTTAWPTAIPTRSATTGSASSSPRATRRTTRGPPPRPGARGRPRARPRRPAPARRRASAPSTRPSSPTPTATPGPSRPRARPGRTTRRAATRGTARRRATGAPGRPPARTAPPARAA